MAGGDPLTNTAIWGGNAPGNIEMVIRQGDTVNGELLIEKLEWPWYDSLAGSGMGSHISDQGELLWSWQTDPQRGQARALVVSYFGDPPPPLPELVGLEAVQVVQDWKNSVPLYKGKPTVVRAHIKSEEVREAEIVLRVFDVLGNEFDFSPLPVDAPGGSFSLRPDGDKQRKNLAGSANFTLPAEAFEDFVSFKVENLSGGLTCSEVVGHNPNDCTLEVRFLSPRTPQIRILGLNWFDTDSNELRVLDRGARLELMDRLISAYPINNVRWDDRQVFWPGKPVLDQILVYTKRFRALDKCSTASGCRRIFYSAIRKHSLAGVAYGPGYAGTGFMHPNPQAEGRHTHSHEFGHSLGRPHSVAGPPILELVDSKKRGPCNSKAKSDTADFPHLWNIPGLPRRGSRHPTLRQTLGPLLEADDIVYGYDSLQQRVVNPKRMFDLMGYCSNTVIDMWPSIHTYSAIASELDNRYPAAEILSSSAVAQDYMLVSGTIDAGLGKVTLLPIDWVNSQLPDVSPSGTWQAQLLDSGGSPISTTSFEPEVIEPRGGDEEIITFMAALAAIGGGVKVEIKNAQDQVVAVVEASPNAPEVTLLSPNGGDTLMTDEVLIEWSSSDADGDSLTHTVQFSPDNGSTWTTMSLDWQEQNITLPREILPATDQGLFRVIASDGFNQAQDDSNTVFTVANSGPTIRILAPGEGRLYFAGERLNLRASAYDTEDGSLDGASIAWSSDLDGALGTGTMLQVEAMTLTLGDHLLTATATDSMTTTGSDTVMITIVETVPDVLVDVGLLLTDLAGPKPAQEPHVLTLRIENAGPDPVDDLQVELTLQITPIAGALDNRGNIIDFLAPPGWTCLFSGLTATCDAPELSALGEAEIEFVVIVEEEAAVTGSAEFSTAITDWLGANDIATTDYRVGIAERVFVDGFE